MISLTEDHLKQIEAMADEWPHKISKQLIGYLNFVRAKAQADLEAEKRKAEAEAPGAAVMD